MTRDLPVPPMQLLPHSQEMPETHCVVPAVVFMSELLEVCLVLMNNLMLYIHLNSSETLFTYGSPVLLLSASTTAALGVDKRVNKTL
jgi:hypothetical protein